jgi:hypothetical protein
MGTVYCDGCGTSLEERARFCRACGKPTPLSEAATKKFEEQPEARNLTSPVGVVPTTPAYLAPSEQGSFQTNDLQTHELRSRRQRRNLIILVSLLAVMIFALAGLLAFLSFGVSRPAGPPPPPPPLTGIPPPIRPAPPASPGVGTAPSKIDPSLIYPGSRQTMAVEESGKSVLQLQSNDSIRKVVDWYLDRLKAAKKVSIVGQTILQSGEMTVLIVGGEDVTEILITRESDGSSR